MRMIYLAQPIDRAGYGDMDYQSAMVTVRLMGSGYAVYRPADAWQIGQSLEKPDRRVQEINNVALDKADAVVALLPISTPSVGVPMEIERALARGIAVVVVTEQANSFALARDGIHVVDHSDKVVETLVDAMEEAHRRRTEPSFRGPGSPLPIVGPEAFLPTRAYDDDAGLDLFISEDVVVPSGAYQIIQCGIRMQLPGWAWGLVVGRSSTARNRQMLVIPSVMDTGWRGPIFVGVYNFGREARAVRIGDRLAQLIVMHNHTRSVTPVLATELSPHPRGENGFGSSGT